jgi:hypothetical protein
MFAAQQKQKCIKNLLLTSLITLLGISSFAQEEKKEATRKKIEWQAKEKERKLAKALEEKQRQLAEEQRKLEEQERQKLLAAQQIERAIAIQKEKEANYQEALMIIEKNNNLPIFFDKKVESLYGAKFVKVEVVKFPTNLYNKAHCHYKKQAFISLLNEKEQGNYYDSTWKISELVLMFDEDEEDEYMENYRHLLSYKKYFKYGQYKGISFDAFIAYIRHNYTNYDFLLLSINHDEQAYSILKERVNILIKSILIVISCHSDNERYKYSADFLYLNKRIDKSAIKSLKWDFKTRTAMEEKYKST